MSDYRIQQEMNKAINDAMEKAERALQHKIKLEQQLLQLELLTKYQITIKGAKDIVNLLVVRYPDAFISKAKI